MKCYTQLEVNVKKYITGNAPEFSMTLRLLFYYLVRIMLMIILQIQV